MKCTNCGAEISDDSKFCGVCGSQIEDIQTDDTEYTENNAVDDTVVNDDKNDDKNDDLDFENDAESPMDESYSIEPQHNNSGKIAAVSAIGLILIAIIIVSSLMLLNRGNVVGVWEKEDNSIFGMFDSTYIEFMDNGRAKYYTGFMFGQELEYSYNKMSNTITFGDGANKVVWHIRWHGRDVFTVEESGDVYRKSSDVTTPQTDNGYDEQYNTGPAVTF